jgi:anti-sigma-K factor RskA
MADKHADLRDLIPAYALGSLDADEAVDVDRHLKGCAPCRKELAAYEAVVDALALAALDADPSPELRRRLLAEAGRGRLATDDGAAAASQMPPARPRIPQTPPSSTIWRRPAWAGYALAALLLVSLGLLIWLAGRTPDEALPVTLSPADAALDAAPDALGELRFDPAGGAATLEVWRMPPLPADRQYQLWLVRDGKRDSGAVFSVNDNGWAELPIEIAHSPDDFTSLGVTIEPAGGSPGPTGDKVLEYTGDG